MEVMDIISLLLQLGGIIIVAALAIAITVYVVTSLAIVRALRICGFQQVWMAWIPYAQYWALGRAAAGNRETMDIFGRVNIPTIVFQLWWLVTLGVSWILPDFAFWINLVIQIVMLGTVYANIYARIENKNVQECQVIGYLSGFLPIISIVKFLCYDKNLRV